MLRIGLDFDNTIICYDDVFYSVARDMSLVPEELPGTKNSVRDYLRKTGREDDWTELQGIVYGPQIYRAQIFAGVFEFLGYCRENKIPVYIVSHKTRYPYLGEKYDLHAFALEWLDKNGFFNSSHTGITRGSVFLEATREDKMKRIGEISCTHFMDDLPDFLSEKSFPAEVVRILFDPKSEHSSWSGERVAEWHELPALIEKNWNGRNSL